MTKTFCDRCGKEITKEYGWITHRTLYASIRLLPAKKREGWTDRVDQYICPECEDSYIRWFMNPKTEDRRRSGMPDREKVIKGLENCIIGFDCPSECPYLIDCKDLAKPMFAELAKDALALLKEQEARAMTLEELAFYDSGIYVETHNGCPEGLTDELWPALVHLYCVSQNGEHGYVSFANWNADTYDFEAKDYNVNFRCWTSKPTDEQRQAVKWE